MHGACGITVRFIYFASCKAVYANKAFPATYIVHKKIELSIAQKTAIGSCFILYHPMVQP